MSIDSKLLSAHWAERQGEVGLRGDSPTSPNLSAPKGGEE
jgi:hypothetical protein